MDRPDVTGMVKPPRDASTTVRGSTFDADVEARVPLPREPGPSWGRATRVICNLHSCSFAASSRSSIGTRPLTSSPVQRTIFLAVNVVPSWVVTRRSRPRDVDDAELPFGAGTDEIAAAPSLQWNCTPEVADRWAGSLLAMILGSSNASSAKYSAPCSLSLRTAGHSSAASSALISLAAAGSASAKARAS